MRALDPEVKAIVWQAFEPLIPAPVDYHPLGRHRRRKSDYDCYEVLLVRLVTGCSVEDAERLCGNKVSDTTARSRRDEWIAAGIDDRLVNEALAAFDKVVGLRFGDVAADGSLHKSPGGDGGTGKSPVDRSKLGWTWHILTDLGGIPFGWVADGANRNDSVLLVPTLEDAATRGWLAQVTTIWLDRGYDSEATRERLATAGVADAVSAQRRKRARQDRRRANRWDSAGRSSGRTRGSRTLVACGGTTTTRPSTGSLNSPSRLSSSSRRCSSTGETAGCRTFLLFAEPLTFTQRSMFKPSSS